MRLSEIARLVWLNLSQNKFKVLLTSIGIVVGAATIMMVIAIGQGGQQEIEEQFKNLNAGAIDISYDAQNAADKESGSAKGAPGMPSSAMMQAPGGGGAPSGGMQGGMQMMRPGMMGGADNRINEEAVSLTQEDAEDLEVFVPGVSEVTISFYTSVNAEGGNLEESSAFTAAGVKSNYEKISNLELLYGEFLTTEQDDAKQKVCVIGYQAAKSIFQSVESAYQNTVYLEGRPYTVIGVLDEMGTVASGINPDTALFLPYNTAVKYITGNHISPTITLIASDVEDVAQIIEYSKEVLLETYPNTEFTISDAGSKMEAASKSNQTLTLLLWAMALIVFTVGGIGIMNVLFVSVKERTNEIGILKAIGCSRRDILTEFLLEAGCISLLGSVIGVISTLVITPVLEQFSVRVLLSAEGAVISLAFGVLTGSLFGFYPAYKASRLIPVVALNQE